MEILRAFAQAQIPAEGALPGAEVEGGVDVIGPAQRVLAAAPARVTLMVRMGLRVLQWTSFPRRFTSLPLARRVEHISRLESGRSGVLRDLTLLCKTITAVSYARDPAVLEAIGARSGCEPAHPGAAPDAGRPAPLDPREMVAPRDLERCDAVIVGSGAGGASAARVLAEAGLEVIVVEQGGYHDASTYPADPIDAMTMLYRDAGLTICEGRPAIPVPVGRCVGGTTVVNSGTCLRPPGEVLRRWRDEFGIAWATDLDAELDAVDEALGLTDVELAFAGRNAELCHAGAEAIGASNGPLRRNAPVLRRCGTCATGCRIDAKRAMHVGELPRAVAAGARLRANARVAEVLVRHERAAGVACRLADGGRYEVRAPVVILAAGAFGTPELLLRQGIANASGAAGRHLRIHPACWVGARFDEPVRGWDGVMQSWKVDEWHGRGLFLEATFTPPSFGAPWLRGAGEEYVERLSAYDHLAVIGVHLADRSEGRVRVRGGGLRLGYGLRDDDAAALRFGIARAADVHFAAGAREVYPQIGGVPPLRSAREVGAVEHARVRPADLRLEGFHPMGTTRMGADPRSCVVDTTGESHDVPGLYVADTGIFPTSLRVNPMVTAMACARHIAAGIAARAG